MKLESLKDLENVMKLCRKHGVKNIIVDNVKLLMDDIEPVVQAGAAEPGHKAVYSEDDVLTWSSAQVS